MGRNSRRRAEEREEKRHHGVGPEDEAQKTRDRCPRCGSTHLVKMSLPLGVMPDVQAADVVCTNCNWQGKLGPVY